MREKKVIILLFWRNWLLANLQYLEFPPHFCECFQSVFDLFFWSSLRGAPEKAGRECFFSSRQRMPAHGVTPRVGPRVAAAAHT